MKRIFPLIVLFSVWLQDVAAQPSFTASEAQTAYYQMGWDSMDEATTWSYSPTNSGNFTWHLNSAPIYSGQPTFTSIDPQSHYSLCVKASSQSSQNEVCASPTIEIRPNSTAEFYACFRSVFLVFASWYFYVIDIENDSVAYKLDAFMWSQEHAYTGPSWQKFLVDLSPYAGMKASFAFQYTGPDGEDLAIDGFRLLQNTEGADAHISIFEEESVHFVDTSVGATGWHWQMPGGEPSESTDQHPVVRYPDAGTYDVTLTIDTPDGLSEPIVRHSYVEVKTQAPTALIGMDDAGYLSPWAAAFIAPGQAVHYRDLSTGKPTAWQWTFEGGSPSESQEREPVVTYEKEGRYGMTLDVSNKAGTSNDFMKDALQVGGSQYVWNIRLDEYDRMGEISLGLFGYYGGTNWLAIDRFAEQFDAPAVPATIDSVQVWFYSTHVLSSDAEISVDVRRPALGGKVPVNKALATATIRASDIAYDPDELVPTTFVFDEPVSITGPFFITIGPFPNAIDEQTGEQDAISIMGVHRGDDGLSTTSHYMENQDSEGNGLGTWRWWQNTDEPISLCITPRLTYVSAENSLYSTVSTSEQPSAIYDLNGRQNSTLHRGLNIIRRADGTTRKVVIK